MWLMHPCCQLELEPADFHKSNENQAKEPFSSSSAEVELNQNKTSSQNIRIGLENIRVGQMFAKDNIILYLSQHWS
jgi:hypothetical protein